MIKLFYDLDINLVKNYKATGNNGDVENRTLAWNIGLLREYDNIESLHFLGGGGDSIIVVDSTSMRSLVIEPANGIAFAYYCICELIEHEKYFSKQNLLEEYSTHISLSETIFRHFRNGDEYCLEIIFEKVIDGKKELTLKYPNTFLELSMNYQDFVVAIIAFGEKVYSFFNYIIPEFKDFKVHDQLFDKIFGDNLLRQKYGHLISSVDNISRSFVDSIPSELKF